MGLDTGMDSLSEADHSCGRAVSNRTGGEKIHPRNEAGLDAAYPNTD